MRRVNVEDLAQNQTEILQKKMWLALKYKIIKFN